MKKRFFGMGMLALVLIFGLMVVGCKDGEEDVTVTFDANGGKWDDGSTTKSVKVAYDSSWDRVRTMATNPSRQSYTFKQWSTVPNPDPNTVYSMGNFDRDRTVYALWE
jgi:2-polyprenyl-6-methoxyphenol hydroxylase-like FAD-dependent oxidoreductase